MAELLSLCTFSVGAQPLALPLGDVQEVLREAEVTPVPLAPPAVLGLVNLRGQIATAIDLRVVLGLSPAGGAPGAGVHVVVRAGGGLACLRADAIGDVVEVAAAALERAPETLGADLRDRARGVCKLEDVLIPVLEPARVVDAAEPFPEATARDSRPEKP